MAFLCFPVALLAQQQSPLPELPADIPKGAVVRMWLTDKTPSGQDAVWKSPDGTIHEFFQFNDRGRGPKTTTVFAVDANGIPSSEITDGNDYLKADVHEEFSLAAGNARWKNKAEHSAVSKTCASVRGHGYRHVDLVLVAKIYEQGVPAATTNCRVRSSVGP